MHPMMGEDGEGASGAGTRRKLGRDGELRGCYCCIIQLGGCVYDCSAGAHARIAVLGRCRPSMLRLTSGRRGRSEGGRGRSFTLA